MQCVVVLYWYSFCLLPNTVHTAAYTEVLLLWNTFSVLYYVTGMSEYNCPRFEIISACCPPICLFRALVQLPASSLPLTPLACRSLCERTGPSEGSLVKLTVPIDRGAPDVCLLSHNPHSLLLTVDLTVGVSESTWHKTASVEGNIFLSSFLSSDIPWQTSQRRIR